MSNLIIKYNSVVRKRDRFVDGASAGPNTAAYDELYAVVVDDAAQTKDERVQRRNLLFQDDHA
jgi:hypothetical protein